MISSDASAKIYKSSGGRFDQKDQKGIAGVQYNGIYTDDGHITIPPKVVYFANEGALLIGINAGYETNATTEAGCNTIAGITQDSGVADRTRAVFSLLQDGAGDVAGHVAGTNAVRYLQVSCVCQSFQPMERFQRPRELPLPKGTVGHPPSVRRWSRSVV